jgi:hypothetical protein
MNRWALKRSTLGLAAGIIVASLSPAEAKTINMGSISRSDVSSACNRARGSDFGIGDLQRAYGCATKVGQVYCSSDGECVAQVPYTTPMTGNSLDFVLTHGRNTPAAAMIQPLDPRIVPLKQQSNP